MNVAELELIDIMKKILFYIDTMYRGGAQRVMANLSEYFSEQGYYTILVNDFIQNNSKSQYRLSDRVERIYLRKKLDGNLIVKNVSRIIKLRKIVKETKPDVILSFLGRPNERMLLATIGIKTLKYVSVRNDPSREYGVGLFQKWFARQIFKLADGCVFQTKEASEYFTKDVKKKSTIILNPISKKFFAVERDKAPHNIITIGRIESQKNQKLLVDAFSRIAEEFPKEQLIIYGDGTLRNELKAYIASLGLEGRIELPGSISNIEGALAKAKLFVLSSNYEGLPNALMEAMAAGVPCIATNCPCGGPRELIENRKNGILIELNDIKGLEMAMREYLTNAELATAIGNAAKFTAEKFRDIKVLKQWENFLFPPSNSKIE